MERRVLIVESQNEFALTMASVLKDAGYQTTLAASAGDAAGAAEKYIQYLNSTEAKDTPERSEGLAYLKKEFGITSLGSIP